MTTPDATGTTDLPDRRASAAFVAQALVDLLEEPFATCEDVGLDVRRIERQPVPDIRVFAAITRSVDGGSGVDRASGADGASGLDGLVVELADGSQFQFAIARTA